jgi:two-component system KDP operon response regulator KdpE
MTNKAKILVIDDEPQIRRLLKITLEVNDFEVVEADTGNLGVKLAASIMPDIILLDLNLPDIDGYEVLAAMRDWCKAQVIALSVRNSEEDKIKMLDAGADDYICKPFHSGELLARIRAALRHKDSGAPTMTPIIHIGDIELNLASRTVKKANKDLAFTATEFSILKYLALNKNMALSHKQILTNVWGDSYADETQYLRVFIRQIRKKIEDDFSAPKYIKTISGVGYILGE